MKTMQLAGMIGVLTGLLFSLPVAALTPKMSPEADYIQVYVPAPPSNIRSAPDGKILCTVKQVGLITVYGWSTGGIADQNGAWFTTDYCGENRRGVIHNSQFVVPN